MVVPSESQEILKLALLKTPTSKSIVRNVSSVTIQNSGGFQYPCDENLGKNEQPLQKGSKKLNDWLNSEHLLHATDFFLFNVTDPDHVIGKTFT